MPAVTLKIRGGCDGGGKGCLTQTEQSATLGCSNDQYLFVAATTITGDHQRRVSDYTAIVADMRHRLRYLVRRLTPLECERLQGYPDGWTDIPEYIDDRGRTRKVTDRARYKALGNSVAIPCVHDVLSHMALYLPAGATLGSLFDGIGGFPLVWERLHGSGTAIWASEIEPYPQAVTAYHFAVANKTQKRGAQQCLKST